jgi:hypothetical protein
MVVKTFSLCAYYNVKVHPPPSNRGCVLVLFCDESNVYEINLTELCEKSDVRILQKLLHEVNTCERLLVDVVLELIRYPLVRLIFMF